MGTIEVENIYKFILIDKHIHVKLIIQVDMISLYNGAFLVEIEGGELIRLVEETSNLSLIFMHII